MALLDRIVRWARRKSPWIVHFNSGACNACDIEVVAAFTPRFDVERLGAVLKGSPRHADVLVCTGPVTRQMRDRLRRIHDQMPEPKLVVAIGTCACSGASSTAATASRAGSTPPSRSPPTSRVARRARRPSSTGW